MALGGETGDGYQIGINEFGTHCGKPYGHIVRPGDLINLYISNVTYRGYTAQTARMGPAILKPDEALDVKPHPHIGLSTVTYLFDGEIRHRDSLGTEKVIRPGDINLMTAGRGIVHSERTPDNLRGHPLLMSGLQTWLALPDDKEEIDPAFAHTEKSAMSRWWRRWRNRRAFRKDQKTQPLL